MNNSIDINLKKLLLIYIDIDNLNIKENFDSRIVESNKNS